MKILWLCNVMIPYIAEQLSYPITSFGGWLDGLSRELLRNKDIKLVVCSPSFEKGEIYYQNINLTYYGFSKDKSSTELEMVKILKKEYPDVIHLFGTEYRHSLDMVNASYTVGLHNKVVISIQGLVSVCGKYHFYAGLPYSVVNSFTLRDLVKRNNIRMNRNNFIKRGKYEIDAIKKVQHVIGRTDWDKACIDRINPEAKYHFCNETLRGEFYLHGWDIDKYEKHSIFVSQSNYPIKGFHHVLEAMPIILRKYPDAHLYTTGRDPFKVDTIRQKLLRTYYSKYLLKLVKKFNLKDKVTFLGTLDEKSMCERFLTSHVFVSASSIENSPNSVGEAMLLGVPVVSSDVGGVKNMLTHGEEGFVYQADAPYMLAYYICKVFNDDDLAIMLSENAKKHARVTHDRETNLHNTLEIYKQITEE